MDRKKLVEYLPVFLISATIIVATLIIANGNYYIKNLGNSFEQDGRLVNTITVTGDGKALVTPDILTFSLNFSEVKSTSKEALETVNKKINQTKSLLLENKVLESDIKTSGLNIYPEYEYGDYTKSPVLKGQRATVSLDVKVRGIDTNLDRGGKIIDLVANVENASLGNLFFDLDDKSNAFSEARSAAFKKAESKAQELAKLSKVELLKPVSIVDTVYDYSPMPIYRNTATFEKADSSSGSDLSSGQLEISVNLNVIFGID